MPVRLMASGALAHAMRSEHFRSRPACRQPVRPTEQRWLLGLAVSLAAMGQTASAAEVVERARAEGPINREIAAYLRQMGVNIK